MTNYSKTQLENYRELVSSDGREVLENFDQIVILGESNYAFALEKARNKSPHYQRRLKAMAVDVLRPFVT